MRIEEAEFLNFIADLSEFLKWVFQDYKCKEKKKKRTKDQMKKRKMIKHIFLHALEVSALVFDKKHNSD